MKRFIKTAVIMIVAAMMFGLVGAAALDYEVPDGASVKTARFNVMELDAPGVEFSMLSEDNELVIHISDDTIVYFEDHVPLSDDEADGMTQMVRDVLFGRTLAEVLDGRNLTVTYTITTRSIPPQTSPISVKVLFEGIVPLPDTTGGGSVETPLPFVDVSSIDWFYNPVRWAFQSGIMQGVSATEFAPDTQMTRAMLVTILWRYAGEPTVSGGSAFADVRSGMWYTTAVAWAAENEIVLGYNPTTFGTNDNINREQMYTVLYRYKNFLGLEFILDDEMRLRQFADQDEISEWALDALFLMYDAGIMFRHSTIDNNARPRDPALRGEIAAAMYFFDRNAERSR